MAARVERVPVDLVADDLVDTYRRGARRLELLIADGLRRGLDPDRAHTPDQRRGDRTAAYRQRQLAGARAILADIQANGARLGPVAVARAYTAGIVAVDNVLDSHGLARPEVLGQFGGIHQRQIGVMAANLDRTLNQAATRAGENLTTVFDRADAIAGALDPTDTPLRGVPFIGRRLDDPYRRAALEVLGESTISLETRRQASRQLVARLISDGTTDALTGFVDRAGRRWPLPVYAEMVARTTTREAASRAAATRMTEHGQDLATISSHPHQADLCSPYDGQTFSLSGRDPDHPRLDRLPPFHPRCRHVLTPASAGLDEYEAELERAARETGRQAPPATRPAPAAQPSAPTLPNLDAAELARAAELEQFGIPRDVAVRQVIEERPSTGPRPAPTLEPAGVDEPRAPIDGLLPRRQPREVPFVGRREPIYDDLTEQRRDQQRLRELIDRDPGRPPGYLDELVRSLDADALDDLAAARARLPYSQLSTAEKRARTAELRLELGDDVVSIMRSGAGRKRGLEDLYSTGRISREELEEELEEVWREQRDREDRRQERERAKQFRRGAFRCFSCQRFKPRPSAVCGYCGDDPVCNVNFAGGGSHGGNYWQKARELDREYNYDDLAGAGYTDDTAAFDPNRR